MDRILLWAAPVVLLGVLGLAWLLLRSRRARKPAPGSRARAAAAADQVQVIRADSAANPAAAASPLPAAVPPAAVPHVAGSVAAQREAAVEALRQARRRAAADVARLEAARQARPPVLAPVPAPSRAPAQVPPSLAPTAALPQVVPAPQAVQAPAPLAVQVPQLPQPGRAPLPPPMAGRAQPALPPTVPPTLLPTVPSPALLPRAGTPARPLTVLVVDDSKVVRIKTSRLLEKHGYQVLLADDGLTALACLNAQRVDLVITDVEMPGLDGFALTQRLRSLPRWTRLPVIMITSSDEKHRADAAAVGVDVLLGKPYDEPALLAEVQRALGLAARRAGAGLALQ